MFKKIISFFIFVILFVVATMTSAYWDKLRVTRSAAVVLGDDVALDVTVKVEPSGSLIPTNAVLKPGDVKEVVMSYDVELNTATSTDLDFEVVASDVKIGGEDTYASFVNIVIDSPTKINATISEVTVTVSISDPDSQEAANALKNQTISFVLTFTAMIPE